MHVHEISHNPEALNNLKFSALSLRVYQAFNGQLLSYLLPTIKSFMAYLMLLNVTEINIWIYSNSNAASLFSIIKEIAPRKKKNGSNPEKIIII